jgi:uncharacterized protein YkwD
MRSVALALCCALTSLFFFVGSAPAAQAAGPRLDRGERAIVRAINRARGHYGLHRLHAGHRLARVADAHSRSMLRADYFAHGSFASRVRRYSSFKRVGETLAWNSRCGARTFVRMWLRSPSHRAVLLSRGFRRVGVGRRLGSLGPRRACVVTADFASRR